jgi:hypothetical protein
MSEHHSVAIAGVISTNMQEQCMDRAKEILRTWMEAINARDVDAILALYNEQAVLVPTFLNRILNTPDKLRDYFERLGNRDGLSIELHDNTVIVQPWHDEVCLLTGIYCWRFVVDGALLSFEARFSFLMDFQSPAPIIHHHSSQIPRML